MTARGKPADAGKALDAFGPDLTEVPSLPELPKPPQPPATKSGSSL
jgi:hypothetical protein